MWMHKSGPSIPDGFVCQNKFFMRAAVHLSGAIISHRAKAWDPTAGGQLHFCSQPPQTISSWRSLLLCHQLRRRVRRRDGLLIEAPVIIAFVILTVFRTGTSQFRTRTSSWSSYNLCKIPNALIDTFCPYNRHGRLDPSLGLLTGFGGGE